MRARSLQQLCVGAPHAYYARSHATRSCRRAERYTPDFFFSRRAHLLNCTAEKRAATRRKTTMSDRESARCYVFVRRLLSPSPFPSPDPIRFNYPGRFDYPNYARIFRSSGSTGSISNPDLDHRFLPAHRNVSQLSKKGDCVAPSSSRGRRPAFVERRAENR